MENFTKRKCRVTALISEAENQTAYARRLGYTGQRSVLVLDGKVISHHSVDWGAFCAALKGHDLDTGSLICNIARNIKSYIGHPSWVRSFAFKNQVQCHGHMDMIDNLQG